MYTELDDGETTDFFDTLYNPTIDNKPGSPKVTFIYKNLGRKQ